MVGDKWRGKAAEWAQRKVIEEVEPPKKIVVEQGLSEADKVVFFLFKLIFWAAAIGGFGILCVMGFGFLAALPVSTLLVIIIIVLLVGGSNA